MQLTRREWLALIVTSGPVLLLAACGQPAKAVVTATVSGSSTSAAGGSSTASATGSGSATATGSGSSSTVVSGGPQTGTAPPMSMKDAQRVAAAGNGHWRGSWLDDAGHSGDWDMLFSLNAGQGSARATIDVTGAIFGSEVPDTTYDIYNLLSFLVDDVGYDITGPQFGDAHLNGWGASSTTGTLTNIPGHPEISKVDIAVSIRGQRADLTYTTHLSSGGTVKGTMAWSSAGDRATPAPVGSSDLLIQNGTYAAGLLTAAQLTGATGTPFADPQPNGGKLHDTPTINVSNATATSTSGRYQLEYSVYLGTPAAISAFWKTETASSTDPLIPGPWSGAFFWSSIQTFYGYSPGGAYELKLIDTKATRAPDDATLSSLSARLGKVAKALNASLNR